MNLQCSKSNSTEAVLKGIHLSNLMNQDYSQSKTMKHYSNKIIMKDYSNKIIMNYLDKIIMNYLDKIIMMDSLYLTDLLLKTIVIIFSMTIRNYNLKNHFLILIQVKTF
jgi:hypothetical protein